MIVFRADRERRPMLIVAAALLLGSGPALAQIGPPVPLEPPTAAQPVQSVPPPATPAPDEPKTDISAAPLEAPDPASGGALDAGQVPLPPDLWQGVDRAFVVGLLPKIAASTSPALNALAFRLLASPAAPPTGAADASFSNVGDPANAPDLAFLAGRAERLANGLGRPDAAALLLSFATGGGAQPAVERVAVDLNLLAGNDRSACAIVAARAAGSADAFWDEASASCAILDGRAADARLALDLVRDDRPHDDAFLTLAEAVLASQDAPDSVKLPDTLPVPKALSIALSAHAGAPLSAKTLAASDPAIVRGIALAPNYPADLRLAAAEMAASRGSLPPEKLAEAYLAVPLIPEDREQPLNRSAAAPGPRGRAIRYAAARDATLPAARATFLALLLSDAPRADLYPVLARAVAPLILTIEPSPRHMPEAAEFARALLVAGRPDEAAQWLDVAETTAAAALAPLVRVAGDGVLPGALPSAPLVLDPTAAAGPPSRDAAVQRRTALVAAMLQAIEGDVDPAAPPSGPLADIADQARARHLGGTLVAVFAALGDQGLAAPPATLAACVSGLRTVGLPNEARRVAIDALVAAGI